MVKEALQAEELLVAFYTENVEKLSVHYFSDWAEAVFFVFSGGLCNIKNPLCGVMLDGFKRVLRVSGGGMVVSAGVSVSIDSDGGVVMSGIEAEEIEVLEGGKDKDTSEEGFARAG